MARISDITLPNGTSYDVGQSTGAEFIRGTQTASTGSWTGVTTDSELYDGKEILYFLPYAGSGNATLNLTLKGGTTTGAKNCYYSGTSRLTTHYGANAVIRMTYHKSLNIGGTNYEGWWSEPGRDTDTHWTSHLYAGTGTAANASTTNGNTKITVADNSTVRDSITIKGGGLSTVSSNSSGVVTIYTEDEDAMHWLGYTTTNIYPGDYRTSIDIVDPDGTIRESVTAHVGDVVSYTTNDSSDLNQYNYPKYILDKSELWTLLSGESTDEFVKQSPSTSNSDYEVIFAGTTGNNEYTGSVKKNTNLTFNPSTGNLQVTQINGVTVGSSPKFTDNNTTYGLSISGHTVSLVAGGTTSSVTVPDNNDNNAVTQTATSTSADYEVLFSSTADNTTRTEGARKNSNLKFNPSTGNLQVTKINGVDVGSSPKFTDNNTTYGLSISDHTVSIVAGGTTSSVTVPDNNTTYTAGTGLSLSGTKFNHSNSVTAATVGTSSATSGRSIAVPYVTYDAQGHITASGTHTHTASVPPSGVVRGDDSTVGGLDPVTAAYIPTAASNKSFGLPANAITIEYSTNAGSTWTSYGATDAEKRNLFNESRGTSFYLGKATAKANNTVNNRLRVTIEPTDRYCSFHGIYVWFSTQGNTTVMDLERSTIGAKDTYTTVFTGQALSGWSGNNIRYFSYGTFGGGSTQTGNTYKYRVTFRQTAVNTNYASSIVMDIRFLGDNIWTYPSDTYVKNMLMSRTAYGVDATGNVILPQGITVSGSGANGFTYSGIEAGTAAVDRSVWFASDAAVGRPVYDNDFKYNPSTNNLTVGKINGYTIAASVPSGAKFTDTTYTANTTSIGSASAGTAIPADDITAWSAGTAASASVANGVLTITNGTAPSLSYTAKSIPNISVTATTVATGITAS